MERPWFTRYNILTDKLKDLIKEVDDQKYPLEIHRYIELRLEEKDAQLADMQRKTHELEQQIKQVN